MRVPPAQSRTPAPQAASASSASLVRSARVTLVRRVPNRNEWTLRRCAVSAWVRTANESGGVDANELRVAHEVGLPDLPAILPGGPAGGWSQDRPSSGRAGSQPPRLGRHRLVFDGDRHAVMARKRRHVGVDAQRRDLGVRGR